jgi:hypothetical protein
VVVSGDYAYVADEYFGLRVIDISDPGNPSETAFYDTPGEGKDVFVNGNIVYVADSTGGVQIISVSDPEHPDSSGHMDTPGTVDILSDDNFLFVANGKDRGLRIYNIDDMSHPVEVGYYDTPGWACGVAVQGNYAYVADGDYFGIYDCSEAMGVPNHTPGSLPQTVTLYPCYPNPFNPMTTISFDLPVTSEVSLTVYNVNGQEVQTLVNDRVSAGSHNITFDGARLSSGTYFYTLNAGAVTETKKMMLLK